MGVMLPDFVATFAGFVLGTVLVLAGLSKIGARDLFRRALRDLGFASADLRRVLGLVVPGVELAAGTLALVGVWPPGSVALAGALIAVFSAPIFVATLQGRAVSCGCFGPGRDSVTGWPVLARNGALVALAAAGVAGATQAQVGPSGATRLAAAACAGCVVSCWALVAGLRRLLAGLSAVAQRTAVDA